ENTDRDLAEVKRRQRERLQSAAKRRSTATCFHGGTRKTMEGVSLGVVFFLPKGSSQTSGVLTGEAGPPRPHQGNGLSRDHVSRRTALAKDSRKAQPNWTLKPLPELLSG
ncbi:hypothetical protein NFI96_008431, partial [Prochilodus magdalenae]